ncbi:MAG: hypothetical protein JNN30_08480 [Rhodanobacteraceae bacterium]|nr:hypothetical protein [Rhodanobacteraceae bacterium]
MVATALALPATTTLAQGVLDQTFGSNGSTHLAQTGPTLGMAIEAGGNITIGVIQNSVGMATLALTRLLSNGLPDTGFGNLGESYPGLRVINIPFTLDASTDFAYRGGFALTPGGGYYLAATGVIPGVRLASFIVKIRADGTLDESYGEAGVVSEIRGIASLAVTSDGRLVVTGQELNFGRSFILRLLSNGERDRTFAGGQVVYFDSTGVAAIALAARQVLITAEGSYLVVADAVSLIPSYRRTALLRFTQDGVRDWGFSNGRGVLVTDTWREQYHYGKSAVPLADGSVLIAGSSTNGCEISRWSSDGIQDQMFGSAGKVTIAPDLPFTGGNYHSSLCLDVLASNDGRTYVVGSAREVSGNIPIEANFVARLSASGGSLDPDYGENGIGWPRHSPGSLAFVSAMDPTNRIVIAGATHQYPFYASRLSADSLFADGFETPPASE